MSKTLKNSLISAIGIVIIAATIGIYLLLEFSKTVALNIGIGFVLFSELTLCLGIMLPDLLDLQANKIFSKVGITIPLVFYFVSTAVLFAISSVFTNSLKILWALEIVVTVIVIIILIAVVLFSLKVDSSDQKTLSDKRLMSICEKRLSDLVSINYNKSTEPQLVLLMEKLKYCDKVGYTSIDEKIVGSIMKLEKEINLNEVNLNDLFDEISSLISQRNNELLENKRGGF